MIFKFWDEFKRFALKGNVVDLAVGVIIGGAFGKVVSALVDDVLTPPLGLLIGGVDFSRLRFVLALPLANQPEVAINYGLFLQAVFNFMIVAGALFALIKVMNELHLEATTAAPPPPPPPSPSEEILLLREIRDSLNRTAAPPNT